MVREGHPPITVNSGDREYEDQKAIFLARYVREWEVRGRKVYDTRYWNGATWYRISPAGTVAPPGSSNHESRRAADLGYPYNNRSTAAHRRLQQIAGGFGIKWTGVNFAEDWHWENVGVLGSVGVAAATAAVPFKTTTIPEEEDDMLALKIKDYDGKEHLCTLGSGVFRHLIKEDNPERIKNIVRSDDQWVATDLVELPRLLKTYGCRGQIWRCEKGVFTVLDSETGNLMPGGMWSAALSG